MPVNKNATIRYNVLDKCFRNTARRYYMEDLMKECRTALDSDITKRQIYADISFMESEAGWSIPLERGREGKRVYYYYEDRNFSIANQPLSDNEFNQLNSVINILERFTGLPSNGWVDEVVSTLKSRFNIKDAANIIGFDQNPNLKGLEYLNLLLDATLNKRVLRIEYKGNKENSIKLTFLFHPHYLKQYNSRWYLFGFNDNEQRLSNYPLDRIISVKLENEETYVENTEIDFDEYFKDIVGVTNREEDKVEEVILKCSDFRFKYVVTKPIHHSQKILNEAEHTVSLNVKVNKELVSQILSFGSDVTVISPESLRNEIVTKIKTLLGRYFPEQRDDINKIGPCN